MTPYHHRAWYARGCPEGEQPSIVRDARDILNNSM
jgi:hypothetical protein